MGKTDLTTVLVSVFKISSAGSLATVKCMGHLGEVQFSFPFPSLLLDCFDFQDLKILLGIISFEVIVASSQHYGLKCIFCPILDRV